MNRKTGTGKYERVRARCKNLDPVPAAVAHPCEKSALSGAVEAAEQRLILPILVGPTAKIEAVARSSRIDLGGMEIVDAVHSHGSAAKAVQLAREGRAELLIKGSLHTDELLSAVVARDGGLRTGRRLSHVFIMDVPTYHKVLIVTDAAINIAPTLEDKVDICQNAIDLAITLGVSEPKVAILAAVETVNSRMPATIDAAALCKMAARGQITGGILDGPLAFDNAINKQAARTKGVVSPAAGDPDILLVPDLEAGNILAKQLTFLANADSAGLVLGARVPVILTSRAATACGPASRAAPWRCWRPTRSAESDPGSKTRWMITRSFSMRGTRVSSSVSSGGPISGSGFSRTVEKSRGSGHWLGFPSGMVPEMGLPTREGLIMTCSVAKAARAGR